MSELLLSNGADVHKCSELGRTALHLTADYGYLECAKVLIAAGADLNHLDIDGVASLHLAVGKHNSAVVQLLLQHGAAAVMNSVLPVKCVHGEHCCTAGMTALMICNETTTSCWC
jgi:ankyrin repeat protein